MNAWSRLRARPSVRTSALIWGTIILALFSTGFILVSFVYANTILVKADGEIVRVTTLKKTVGEALANSDLNIYVEDKVNPARDQLITDGMIVSIDRSKPLLFSIDDKSIEARSAAQTVGEAIKEFSERYKLDIKEYDEVNFNRDESLSENVNIKITRAIPIEVEVDGKRWVTQMAPRSVEETLDKLDITIAKLDKLSHPLDYELKPNDLLKVTRVEEEIETLKSTVGYQTVTRAGDFPFGLPDREISAGKNGTKEQVVKVTYEDGQETNREIISQKIITPPVNRIVARGNLTKISRGGNTLGFKRAYQMKATAYNDPGGITATGDKVRVGVVAVDPKVIPLGTRLYIEGYGEAIALDTGGAIKGNRIDLYMNSHKQALNWGVRTVTVYVK